MASCYDEVSAFLDKMSANELEVGNSYFVKVTQINSPDSFYVRPNNYVKYLEDTKVRLCDRGYNVTLEDLSIETLIIFKSFKTDKYSRGLIKKIHTSRDSNNHSFDIFAIDNGRLEKKVPLKHIFHYADPVIKLVNPLAVHCKLANCSPLSHDGSWSEEVIETMKLYIGDCKTRITVVQNLGSKYSVCVDSANSPDDIATLLALVGCSTYLSRDTPVNKTPRFKSIKYHFPNITLSVGNTLVVRMLNGKSLDQFYVADLQSYNWYVSEQQQFKHFNNFQRYLEFNEVIVGMPVVALIDFEGYQRAIIRERLSDDKVIIYAVDLGMTVEISTSKLKPLHNESFFIEPPVAIFCSVDASQRWDNSLFQFLYPGYEFCITVKELGCHLGRRPFIVHMSPIRAKR